MVVFTVIKEMTVLSHMVALIFNNRTSFTSNLLTQMLQVQPELVEQQEYWTTHVYSLIFLLLLKFHN